MSTEGYFIVRVQSIMVGQNDVLLIVDLDAVAHLGFNGGVGAGARTHRLHEEDMQQCGAVTGPRAWCEGPENDGRLNAGRV